MKKGGFGLTYQEVYLMDNLTIEAKAIYGMLCSYAGAGATAYPSVDFMCRKLHISRDRFYKHMNLLVGAGIVEKTTYKTERGTFASNVYTLIPNLQNTKKPYTENLDTDNAITENLDAENMTTNNNSLNNNSINNNRGNIDYQQIADMYNETCVSFHRLTKLSDSRKKAIRARLKQYSVDDFRRMFEMAESSDFLKGKNDKNWSATFDWMIKDANMAKILDGNYQDKADFKPHEETREEREARLMREWEKEHENLPDYNFPPIPEGVEPVIWGDDLE